MYLYAENPYEAKYKLLDNEKKSEGINHFNDSKGFIEYSNDMRGIYAIQIKNEKHRSHLMIGVADMISNTKLTNSNWIIY